MWKPRLSRGSVSDRRQPARRGDRSGAARPPAAAPSPSARGVRRRRSAIGVVHLRRQRRPARPTAPRPRLPARENGCRGRRTVARLLVRQQHAPPGRQRDAAGILARHAPGAIQRQHRARGVRRWRRRASATSASGTASADSSGSANASRSATSSWRSDAAGQRGEVDAERLAQLDQQRGGDRRAGRARSGSDSSRRCPAAPPAPAASGGARGAAGGRAADQCTGHDLHHFTNPTAASVNPYDSIARALWQNSDALRTCNVNSSRISSPNTRSTQRCISLPDPVPPFRRHPPRLHARRMSSASPAASASATRWPRWARRGSGSC